MALNRTAEDVEANCLLSQSRRHNQKEARNKDKVPLSSAPIRIQTKNHSNNKKLNKNMLAQREAVHPCLIKELTKVLSIEPPKTSIASNVK